MLNRGEIGAFEMAFKGKINPFCSVLTALMLHICDRFTTFVNGFVDNIITVVENGKSFNLFFRYWPAY